MQRQGFFKITKTFKTILEDITMRIHAADVTGRTDLECEDVRE